MLQVEEAGVTIIIVERVEGQMEVRADSVVINMNLAVMHLLIIEE